MKLTTCVLLSLVSLGIAIQAEQRIASAGGAITETIYALGAQGDLVAVDTSSIYPEDATKLAKLGYARQLSAEGILSMRPTVLFVNEDAGPPAVLEQVAAAGVRVVRLPSKHTLESARERIRQIGKELGREEAAKKLADKMDSELNAAKARIANSPSRPKVLFIYARGGGMINVSGRDTAADAMIELAGGTNTVQSYEGYKPLTAEGAVAAAPDVILVTTRGLESAGGVKELLKQPGLAFTPAGKAERVIAMDDLYLLGFGPRLGQAVEELCIKLHSEPMTVLK